VGIEGVPTEVVATLADLGPAGLDQGLTSDGAGLFEQRGYQASFDWGQGNPTAPEAKDAPLLQLRTHGLVWAGQLGFESPGPPTQGFETRLEVDDRGRDPDPILDGAGAHRWRA
jgi:hypothetical protein